ncbi:MAG: hypothetical protein G3M70_00285 [Candidatus Nitronauta litoralis]|uniref:DUF4142 domain-containing protein n=1 Tax=Candidatus Nitronauta litoralis TaxID=2705533 RepID=A0A7T0FYN1_9BACT|nr:MAG: hypothetical protein G3M70_00285 [Candidatus Nitronauta litoralis]
MPVPHFKTSVVTAIALLLAFTPLANASDLATCLKKVADEDLNQKISFQGQMRDIIISKQADLNTLATLQHDFQVALGKNRSNRLKYLVDHNIDRISTNELSQFRNFDWTEEDQEGFLKADTYNQEQLSQIFELKRKNQNHPDWPKMREFMEKHLRGSKEFQDLMKTFAGTQANTESQLKSCSN